MGILCSENRGEVLLCKLGRHPKICFYTYNLFLNFCSFCERKKTLLNAERWGKWSQPPKIHGTSVAKIDHSVLSCWRILAGGRQRGSEHG